LNYKKASEIENKHKSKHEMKNNPSNCLRMHEECHQSHSRKGKIVEVDNEEKRKFSLLDANKLDVLEELLQIVIDNNNFIDENAFSRIISIIDGDYNGRDSAAESAESPDFISCSTTAATTSAGSEIESTASDSSQDGNDSSLNCSLSSTSYYLQEEFKPPQTTVIGILKSSNSSRSSQCFQGWSSSSNHSTHTRFSVENNQVYLVPKLPGDSFHELFYEEDEISQFRYEAFWEKINLDDNEDEEEDDDVQEFY
jgi:hypothetical protein